MTSEERHVERCGRPDGEVETGDRMLVEQADGVRSLGDIHGPGSVQHPVTYKRSKWSKYLAGTSMAFPAHLPRF